MDKLPTHTKAVVLQESKVPRTPLYHDAPVVKRPLSYPKPGEVVVKMGAVAFNHKDVSLHIFEPRFAGI